MHDAYVSVIVISSFVTIFIMIMMIVCHTGENGTDSSGLAFFFSFNLAFAGGFTITSKAYRDEPVAVICAHIAFMVILSMIVYMVVADYSQRKRYPSRSRASQTV